jgi:hypothetical protein
VKKYLVLLFVFFGTIVAGQDLAPDSVDNTIYLAIAANRNTPFLFGLSASILSPNGTRTSINASGLPGYSFTEPYRWIKTAPNAGTLVFAADGNVPRFEVVFTSAGKGTVRQVTFSDTGAAVTGSITFAPFPHDLTPALLNLSTRRSLVVGQPSIAGFVVGGPNPRRVLIRAIGPSLAQFGVTGVVANPSLAVFKGNTQIGANAGWGGDASLAAVFASVGAFALPATSADCAMVLTLDPGDYTAQVTANSNGEALIEVYFVN